MVVFILGEDEGYLTGVSSKIDSSRPVESYVYDSLKEFLVAAMQAQPDAIAISMSFNHPKTPRFPKFFKMAMNTPVIAFSEKTDGHSIKAVNMSSADYKIPGLLNATNLWMKLANLQKKREDEAEKAARQAKGSTVQSQSQNQSDSYTVTGSAGQKKPIKSAALDSIMAQLDKIEEEGDLATVDRADGFGQSPKTKQKSSIHIQSSAATKFKKRNLAEELSKMGSGAREDSQGGFPQAGDQDGPQHIQSKSGLNHGQNKSHDHIKSGANNELFNSSDGAGSDGSGGSDWESDLENDINAIVGSLGGAEGLPAVNSSDGSEPLFADGDFDIGKDQPSNSESNNGQAKKKWQPTESPDEEDPLAAEGLNEEEMAEIASSYEETLEPTFGQSPEPEDPEMTEDENELDRRLLGTDPGADPGADSAASEESDKSDLDVIEAEKENELARKRKRQEDKKEKQEKRDILKECCEIALREAFQASPLSEVRDFEVNQLIAITVNQKNLKGYILFANSFNHKESEEVITDIIDTISINLEKNGLPGDISQFFDFEVPEVDYIDWAEDRCDFNVTYEQETGRQVCLSFISREQVLPKFSDADDKEMILVDIQHIPPGTPVNFDAFIHLPRNNKYVRLLKKGRSLGLNQVKRLIKEEPTKKLFIPKEEKHKFIQFFILNTIGWEFITYLKERKKSS